VDQASGDWVFNLDPDERLPELLVMEIEETLENNDFEIFSKLYR